MTRTYRGEPTATQVVFELIGRTPGLSTQEIARQLSERFEYKTVKRAINNLCENRYEIVNRGKGTGHPAEWHVAIHDPMHELADRLLTEMEGMTSGMRRAYLAEKLEALASGETL